MTSDYLYFKKPTGYKNISASQSKPLKQIDYLSLYCKLATCKIL